VQSGKLLLPMFWRNLLPPPSEILRSVYQITWHLTLEYSCYRTEYDQPAGNVLLLWFWFILMAVTDCNGS
jgi:hypothetical protein